MTHGLTDWLQQSRLIVVSVDPAAGRVRLKGVEDLCTDLTCGADTRVTSDDVSGGLEALNAGDIVRVEARAGAAQKIVVVRRVWDELSSPEF